MSPPAPPAVPAPAPPAPPAPPRAAGPGTPLGWRLALLTGVLAVGLAAYAGQGTVVGPRGQAAAGLVCFVGLVAAFSADLRSVRGRTLAAGIALQLLLAVGVLHVPAVRHGFEAVGRGINKLLEFATAGGEFVFGNLAHYGDQKAVYGDKALFPFAFVALPPIIFVSGFFSVLYYFGVLQLVVRGMAKVMTGLMGTSGAETLSVAANVFMGQTEAPLIVKPFVPRMTQSELLALMASGMAHISGGMMAVYIGYTAGYFGDPGAAAAAILTTCVMACPCSLYLAKLMLPETETPETLGSAPTDVGPHHVNPVDALAAGVSEGLRLALNVAAMLIGFLAMIALANALLSGLKPLLLAAGRDDQSRVALAVGGLALIIAGVVWARRSGSGRAARWLPLFGSLCILWAIQRSRPDWDDAWLGWWPDDLTLQHLLGWAFRPAAFLIGVPPDECGKVGTLLGIKLVANEHVAFLTMTKSPDYAELSDRAKLLAVYALTGFANFASVGIQLGGIGALAPERRADLARLGMRALFVGFVATLVNAALAGILM